jgi:DNA ligase-1
MLPLSDVASVSNAVASTRSRHKKVELLAELLTRVERREVPIVVGHLSGEIRQGKLGLGYRALRPLHAEPPSPESVVTVLELDAAFETMRALSGKGAAGKRKALLSNLYSKLTSDERDFVTRLLLGELRQGALEAILLDAVARASGVPMAAIRRAMLLSGDATEVAVSALEAGEGALERYRLELFRPLRPMLAQSANDASDAFSRAVPCAFEDKLDGARIQVHREGKRVTIYSRQGNDVTASLPELVAQALSSPAESFVLDGEAIALRADGRPHPFQVTMRRFGRKLDVETLQKTLPLHAFFFDCLYLNGEALVERTNRERWECLSAFVPDVWRVRRHLVTNVEEAEGSLRTALAQGHEGVVVKNLESRYEAGRRGAAWLKVKPATTLDLVVLAAEWGSGRRKGWLSNLHLGARDPNGGFVMLGKTFKGLTDATLAWQTKRLEELATRREDDVVFVRPELVVEVAFDGVQQSPVYPGGLALRFARVRRYREDKSAAEADTIDFVRELFQRGGGR